MRDIKLLVSVFKSESEQTNGLIFPISAGAKLYNEDETVLSMRDDEGINISEKNQSYCELTVQYWAWKNLEFDFCGILHQRRYFDFSDREPLAYDNRSRKTKRAYRIFDEPNERTLRQTGFDYDTVKSFTDRYSIISTLRENLYESVSDYYNRNDKAGFDDLGLICRIINEKYPKYSNSAQKYLNGNYSYFCNMFVMNREMFCSYSEWLFDILFEYEKRKPKEYRYPRECGKLGERLFGIYMTYIIDETDIKWAEIPRAHFAEINGTTMKNLSFNRGMYYLCPPGTKRRALLRKLKQRKIKK